MKEWFKNSILYTGLFGYKNFRFVVIELVKVLSGQPSFFSQKRLQANAAFALFYVSMACWLYFKRNLLSNSEWLSDMAIILMIAGYNVSQSQADKKINASKEETPTT